MARAELTWQATAAANLLEARKRHTRLGGKKSRAGCQTCKSRKIKCDETKPECERCTKSGRRCDGYPDHSSQLKEKKSNISLIGGQLAQTLGLKDGERRTFDFFLSRTAPRLAGSLDKDFWCGYVLQLAQAEPLVLDSLLAISTLYEHPQFLRSFRVNPFKTTEEIKRKMSRVEVAHPNEPPPPDEYHSSAIELYNRAIRKFKLRLEEGTATPLLALLSCTLFLCIEVIRDNVYAALSLFTRGTQLLRQYAIELSKEKETGLVRLMKMMFSRLGVIASSLGYPPGMEVPLEFVTIGQQTTFNTIADARTALFALMADSHGFIKDANTWKESLLTHGELADGSLRIVSVEQYPDAIETMYGARFRELDPVAAPECNRPYDLYCNSNPEQNDLKINSGHNIAPAKIHSRLGEERSRYDSHSPLTEDHDPLVNLFEQTRLSYEASIPSNIRVKYPNLADLPEREVHFQKRVRRWFDAFQSGPRKQAEQTEPEMVSYLLMYYHASFVWNSTRLNLTQQAFDNFTQHFEGLVHHAEIYIKAKGLEQPIFTFEVGAVPPLYFAASKCRSPLLRRRALDLMSEAPRKECIFGASSTAELACRLIEIEEEGLGLPLPNLSGRCADAEIDDTVRLPEENRVHNIELLKNKATESFTVRTTRYSEVDGRLKRNVEDVPL